MANTKFHLLSEQLAQTTIGLLPLLLALFFTACRQPDTTLPTPAAPAAAPTAVSVAVTAASAAESLASSAAVNPTPLPIAQANLSALPPLTFQIRAQFSAEGKIIDLALIDLTGGGLPDIVASAQDQYVYVFDLGGIAFRAYYPDLIPIVEGGDMDNDMLGDVFLGSNNQTITIAEADLRAGLFVTRGAPVTLPGRVTAVATLNNNQQTLLVGTDNGSIVALNLDLSQAWTVALSSPITHLLSLNNPAPLLIAADSSGALAAYDADGAFLWEHRLANAITAVTQSKINPESPMVIVAAALSGEVWAANAQGNELWQWMANEPVTALFAPEGQAGNEPAVVVGSGAAAGQLTALDGSGRLLWQATTGYPPLALNAADVDGDGRLDILVGTDSGDLLIFDANGGLRGRVTLSAPVSRLIIANIDATPEPELLAVAGNVIYLLDTAPATTTADLPATPDPALVPTATTVAMATVAPLTPTLSLPDQPRPSYEMQVDLNYAAHTAVVTQTVTVPNHSTADWPDIVFHAAPAYWPGFFNLESVALTTPGVATSAVTPAIANTMITLPLPAPLPAGASAQVEFRYRLNLPRLDPLGWGPVGNAGWGPTLIQMGDWYPALVPYDSVTQQWQTWRYTPVGDPVRSVLADFSVGISTDPNVMIAAPGYVATNGDTRSYRLENGRAFAFLASPNYTLLEGYSQNTPVRVYVLREHEALAPTVLNTAVQALNLFRNRFGPYPHEELIIAENGFLTAMEYSAIISLSGFAFNEYNNSFRSLLTPITAHEVAHQWWYSAVGNDQVLEPWLDEALCMFAELIYYETYHPNDVEWWWQYRVHRWNPTGYVDATIYDYNNSPDFVHDLYSQSAYFLRDLRAQMGAANFNNFLRAYYQRYRNQTVTTNDFFTLAQDYTTADLRPLVSRYFTTLPAALSSP